jgi:hypothetical protein
MAKNLLMKIVPQLKLYVTDEFFPEFPITIAQFSSIILRVAGEVQYPRIQIDLIFVVPHVGGTVNNDP